MATTIEMKNLNRSMGQIGRRLKEAGDKLNGDLDKILFIGGNSIRTSIILSIQKDKKTGFVYNFRGLNPGEKPDSFRILGGRLVPVKLRNKPHQSSASGESPANDTGELLRSILFEVSSNKLEIGSAGGAPYAPFLEEGTKNMKPRPFLQPAVDKHEESITNKILEQGENIIERAFQIKAQKTAEPDLGI